MVGECENNVLGVINFNKTAAGIASVRIYPLAIERILPRWEEEGTRSRRLFLIDRAIRIMKTEESAEVLRNLKALILSRMETQHGHGN